jgi:glyoxylase-like metal-dependent hydrolase (beta-lactamase superfamily II)
MVVSTVIHVVLNRKGVARAAKVVAGADLRKRVGPVTATERARPRPKRGYAWIVVIASVAALTIGGIVFAADHAPGRSRDHAVAETQDDGLLSRYEDTTLPDATNLVIGDESPDDQPIGRRGRR